MEMLHGEQSLGRAHRWGEGPAWEHAGCVRGTKKRAVWWEASQLGTTDRKEVTRSQAM